MEIETASFRQEIACGGPSNLEARQGVGNIDGREAVLTQIAAYLVDKL